MSSNISKYDDHAGNNGIRTVYLAECGHEVPGSGVKRCRPCRTQFCPNGHDKTITGTYGRNACKVCVKTWTKANRKYDRVVARDKFLKLRYGIGQADFEIMRDAQDGKCYLCNQVPDKILFIDHDHSTGEVRKLLCHNCNIFVGIVETSGLARFRQALEYLSE